MDHLTTDGSVYVSTAQGLEIGVRFNNYDDEEIVEMMVNWLESDGQVTLTRKFTLADVLAQLLAETAAGPEQQAKLDVLRGELVALVARIDALKTA